MLVAMCTIKRLTRIVFFISLFILFIPDLKELQLEERVDLIINNKKINKNYEGYLYIPKFNYKNIIKNDISYLDDNYIVMMDYSDKLDGSTIVLAGHNNRYVFNKLYYLDIGDEVVLSNFSVDYHYIVKEKKYIEVDDYSEINIKDSLILITCSYDNQKRYIVILKKE